MIKANVCCVPLVKRLHEMVAQSVKIVVLVDMVMVAKNAKLDSIVPLLWTFPRPVLCVALDGISPILGKQFVFRVRLANIKTLKEKRNVLIAKLDVRQTLLGTIKANVCCVPLVKRLHELVVQSVRIVVPVGMAMAAKNVK